MRIKLIFFLILLSISNQLYAIPSIPWKNITRKLERSFDLPSKIRTHRIHPGYLGTHRIHPGYLDELIPPIYPEQLMNTPIKAVKTLERRLETIQELRTLEEERLIRIPALKSLEERRLETIKALKTLEERRLETIKALKTLEIRLKTTKALKTLEKTTKALKTLERRFKTIKALKTLERRFKTIKALKTLERRLKTIKALKTLERRLKTIKALKTLEITIKGLKTLERRLETAKALKTLEKTTKALKTLEKTIKGLKTLEKRRFETLAIYLSKFKHRDFMVPLEHSWLFFREGYAIFDVHLEQFYKFHEIFICLEALLKSSSLHRYLHRGSIPFIVMSHVDTFTLKAQIFAYREIEYSFINKHLILLKEIIRLLERRHNLKSFGLIINKKYIKTVYEILKADRSIYLKESAQRVKNATGVARLILGNQIQSRLRLWICSQGRSLYSKNVNAGWLHVFFVKNERHSCALMEHKIRSDDIDICSKTASMPSRDHAKPSDVHTAP